tara:strand:- start:66 stop:2240 length:2175 start_codon:yes stop_codon:yes gene_type:complete
MLQKIGFLPGFNKQITETTAEGQWVDGDNVRFRYGTPQKIGGWSQLGENKLTGAARALFHLVNKSGNKFSIIGTNRILYAYTGGVFYDIHPIKTTTTLTNAFSTTNGSAVVTLTFSTDHNITANDIILLDNFSTITGSNFSASDFDDKKFMVTSVPSATTLTITMSSNESGSGATTSGGIRVRHYYPVGPAEQLPGFGWGLGQWSGTVSGEATTTLVSSINASQTTGIELTDASQFPTSGTNHVQIGTEEISYTGISSNILTGVTRGVRNTTAAIHNAGVTITNSSDYVAWGEAASGDLVIDPGMWSIDGFGSKVIALIHNAQVFEWDADATNALTNRATIISGAPTASRDMLVSTPDRHLVFFGTETTIGTPSTQDEMFIRFSDQEDINTYTPTATNTAGTQRLSDGSKIVGAVRGRDAIYIWSDTSLFTMRFVGAPFTFGFAQVGTNCGLIGQNAALEVDGAAYWMSENGFFKYSGNLETMMCLVEDFVYDDLNTTAGQLVNVGLNNLFGEITWFYCTEGSTIINRCVTYNYIDSRPQRPVWTTGTLARGTWQDSSVFGLPHATEYDASSNTSYDVVGNTDGCTTYYEHEKGTDQVSGGSVTAITANISSGDFDITQRIIRGAMTNLGDIRGDGENIMKIRRFIPDFVSQTGNTQITLNLKNYPNDTAASSSLGPFTISSSTKKVDTRARARAISLKVANTAASQDWKLGTFRLDIQADGRR